METDSFSYQHFSEETFVQQKKNHTALERRMGERS